MPNTALTLRTVLWEEHIALARAARSEPAGNQGTASTPDNAAAIRRSASEPSEPNVWAPGPTDRPSSPAQMSSDVAEIYRCLNGDNHWALCLSGGGIRSAAFAFGVLQRFAAQPIAPKCATDPAGSALQQFEYFSTVSGGGYIGSWLSAWLLQQRERPRAGAPRRGGADAVAAALTGRVKDHEEVGPIASLRRDTHYLAPSFSAISPDVWSDIAAVVRNLCLNWVLLVPPMVLMVLITGVLGHAFGYALSIAHGSTSFLLTVLAATLCFVVALSFSVANRPGRGLINASQAQFLFWDMTLFMLGSALLVFVLLSPAGQNSLVRTIDLLGFSWIANFEAEFPRAAVLVRGALLGLALHLVAWYAARLWKNFLAKGSVGQLESGDWGRRYDLIAWCVAGAVFGILIAAGYLLYYYLLDRIHPAAAAEPTIGQLSRMSALLVTCGIPWVVSARIVADVVFIAYAELVPGADASLEYQARSGGILTLAQLGWLIWFGLVLFAPWLAFAIGRWWSLWIASAGGLAGAFSVVAGYSSKTAAIVQQAGELRKYLTLNRVAAVAAAAFAAILVATLSALVHWALKLPPFGDGKSDLSWTPVLIIGIGLAALIVVVSFVIGINRYSLHSIYRNRLVRAFLGASRNEQERDHSKNRFTDFDSRDSPLLHELWEPGINPRGDDWKPLLIVNAALNLVSSKNLAWQERMATSFTFSALHCGCGSSIFPHGAYRLTHPERGCGLPYGGRLGLTLGTAMAISGAAVSPNMGYNSSPGVAFLMALFNVRLGWWMPNPRAENPHYWRTSPRMALWPYFMEMFGLTSENRRWVYLSDGGHFENLGLYEMVRRRCRVIVVSDAGCDPDYNFDDLGNALRKIWIDLGVRIDICGLDRLKKRFTERPTPATQEPYWAVGRIRYNAADRGGEDGWLLYLKAGLHGTEPVDVLSYAIAHPTFPHESTANQFFSESQFESYRMLGFEIAGRALEAGGCPSPDWATAGSAAAAGLTLDKVINNLESLQGGRA